MLLTQLPSFWLNMFEPGLEKHVARGHNLAFILGRMNTPVALILMFTRVYWVLTTTANVGLRARLRALFGHVWAG